MAHLFTHSHSPSYTEVRREFGGGDAVATTAQFIIAQSFGISLFCATPNGGVLPLYGVAAAARVVFLVEVALIIGFI